jgi:hypothetical protein
MAKPHAEKPQDFRFAGGWSRGILPRFSREQTVGGLGMTALGKDAQHDSETRRCCQ